MIELNLKRDTAGFHQVRRDILHRLGSFVDVER
jgi:hypothetical protein